MMSVHAAASSFSLEGELEIGFFSGRDDSFHARINGERIETVISRMLGFPSEEEFEQALQGGVSADPDQPDVVRKAGQVYLSMSIQEEGSI
jgi:hypothetical protein